MPQARGGQRTQEIDSVVWLDRPMLVAHRLTGQSFNVRIAGRPTVLTVPAEGPQSFAGPAPAPALQLPRFPPPPLAEPTSGDDRRLTLSVSTPQNALVVQGVRLRWFDEDFERAINTRATVARFSRDVGQWLALVSDWLAAWSGPQGTGIHLAEPSPTVRLVLFHAPEAGEFRAGGRAHLIVGNVRVISADEFKGALAAASHGVTLPLEYQLLADARLFASRDEHRHAVINACSAAEVALAQSLRSALARAGHGGKDIDTIVPTSGIVELYRAHALRRPAVPVSIGRVMNALAKPRNNAVHRGDALNRGSAYKAVATARDLIDALSPPIPRPRSLVRSTGATLSL